MNSLSPTLHYKKTLKAEMFHVLLLSLACNIPVFCILIYSMGVFKFLFLVTFAQRVQHPNMKIYLSSSTPRNCLRDVQTSFIVFGYSFEDELFTC